MAQRKFSILVAEDEAFQLKTLMHMLKSCDYDVVGVENGKLAMEEIRRGDKTFDLLLLDLIMPEMNGFEVLARMQEDESLSHIQIIIMSANESNDIISDCLKMGALNYLVKPIKKN
jgi:CheY-like chemotaxis protein